jgi:uncharacterized glyoxalase superfamily protein PhnB
MKMNAIGIVSADMKRSLEFYGLLGVAVPSFDPEEDHFQCQLADGLSLMWDTVTLIQQITPSYTHHKGGPIGLAFDCESPTAVDEVYGRVIAAGFESEKEPWDAFWGQRYAIVTDPDGNAISLYAALSS